MILDIIGYATLYMILVYWVPILAMAPFESMEIINPTIKKNKYLMAQRNKLEQRIRRLRWIPVYNTYLYIVAVIVCWQYIRSMWVLERYNKRTK